MISGRAKTTDLVRLYEISGDSEVTDTENSLLGFGGKCKRTCLG